MSRSEDDEWMGEGKKEPTIIREERREEREGECCCFVCLLILSVCFVLCTFK